MKAQALLVGGEKRLKADKEKIRLAMARACMNAADLSEAAQMPRPTVNGILGGKNCLPASIGKLARALGVDVTEILEEV